MSIAVKRIFILIVKEINHEIPHYSKRRALRHRAQL